MNETEIYTQGLKQDDMTRAASHDWKQVLFRRLRSEYDQITRGSKTAEAETGLGMAPSAYWYVSRLEPDFAYVATLSVGAGGPHGPGMTCPFDTGGLWHDKLTLVAPLTEDEKRQLLVDHGYEVDAFHPTMEDWLNAAYPPKPVDHYSGGTKPRHLIVPEIEVGGSARSWTWELSLNVSASGVTFPPATSLHITQERYDQYESWVASQKGLSTSEVNDHLDFVDDIKSITDDVYKDATQRLVSSVT